MIRRLPPFAALRAFEAAARLCSFKEAAQELALTPSAISHQIKSLEEHLSVRLFYRQHNTVLLTELGQSYLLALRDALTRLDAATAQLQQQISHGRLTIDPPARAFLYPQGATRTLAQPVFPPSRFWNPESA